VPNEKEIQSLIDKREFYSEQYDQVTARLKLDPTDKNLLAQQALAKSMYERLQEHLSNEGIGYTVGRRSRVS